MSRRLRNQHHGYLALKKRRGFNESKVMRKLDEEVRNVQIVTAWDLLSHFTKLKYKEKIQYLMEQHHLSYSRIEDIIGLDKD